MKNAYKMIYIYIQVVHVFHVVLGFHVVHVCRVAHVFHVVHVVLIKDIRDATSIRSACVLSRQVVKDTIVWSGRTAYSRLL